MSLHIIEQDITTLSVDAVVNSTNSALVGYSGVDRLIHDLGGLKFEQECDEYRLKVQLGEAIHTKAYNMDCKYIIHTVGPQWEGGTDGEAAILRSCYRESLLEAARLECKSIAFPLISAGNLDYPIDQAIEIAVSSIKEYLMLYEDMDVYLVLYGAVVNRIAKVVLPGLDEHLAKEETKPKTLAEFLKEDLEDFTEMLPRLIKERKIKIMDLCCDAGITKSAYFKIIHKESHPTKNTVINMMVILHLQGEEALKFMAAAGYSFSNDTRDRIILYFINECPNYKVVDLELQLEKHHCKSVIGDE